MVPLPFDPALAATVKADTLEPHQQPTEPGFKTAADFSEQHMLKYPGLAEFHSRPEHLFAGLKEGDPRVTGYTPHPFVLRVGRRRYPPDFYVARSDGPPQVVEIGHEGALPESLQVPVTHFLALHGLRFLVVSNEAVLERAVEAENWLEIVRILYLARDVDTQPAEAGVLGRLRSATTLTLGDVVDPGDRERTYPQEIALLRLLHRGLVAADLTERPLDYTTRFRPCE